VIILLAKLYRESNDLKKAKTVLDKISSSKKDYLLELFRIYSLENKNKEAKTVADRLLTCFHDINIVYEVSQIYIEEKAFEEFKKILILYLSQYMNDIKLHLYLSKCYEATGDIKKAIDELIFIISLKQQNYHDVNDIYRQISDLNKKQKNGLIALNTLLEIRKQNYPDIYYFDELRCVINKLICDVKRYVLDGNEKDAVLLSEEIIKIFPSKKDMLNNILLNEKEIKEHKIILESKPRILEITLTNKCNLNCIMCSNIKMKDWDIPVQIKDEVIALMPYLEQINWLGGEVFLYKNFEELFDIAAKNYVKQIISTNALLMTESIIKKFMYYDVELSISIDGITKEIYEKIRIGGSFAKLISQLNLINKLKYLYNPRMKKRLCIVVLEENYSQLEDAVDFAHEYEFDSITFTPVNDYLANSFVFYKKEDLNCKIQRIKERAVKYNIELENCLPTKEQYIDLLKNKYGLNFEEIVNNKLNGENNNITTQINKKYQKCYYIDKDISENYIDNISCFSPWQKLFIDCMGFVKTNCNCDEALILGNINDISINDIWNNNNIINLRHNLLVNKKYNKCADNCKFNVIPYEKLRYTY
ncbi:MAG: radical SAM protein, partial [Endomicrobiaceae bacterium]|nr:radical SAM protein [Endomicrobiaceae bacterium]